MAAFNGDSIFGYLQRMQTVFNNRAYQANAYPSQSGTEELDNGQRGKFTTCAGILLGSGPSGLADAEAFFRSYDDGRFYLLYDNLGVTWPFVKLESFTPTGGISRFPSGVCLRRYEARFRHLL